MRLRTLLCLPAAFLLAASSASAAEKLPDGLKVTKLEARPASVSLQGPYSYSQLLVTAITETGDAVDATRMVGIAAPASVKVSPNGLVRPVADGTGELVFTLAGQTLKVPVTVAGQKDAPAVSFLKDVQPVLGKMGCNQGTCHGAASGKNGFQLSLRGYDPVYDYRALTDDLEGRRFNRAAPDRSLMLLKPSGAAPHVGGVLTQPGEPYYELLRSWISQGVKFDGATAPKVTSIEVFPKGPVVPRIGLKQQMAVVATYTDGTTRDVTAEAFVESSNNEVATVDKSGLVTTVRRGEATMLARYEGSYAASTLIVMGDRSGFVWKDVPRNNWIDELVDEKLKAVKVQVSDLCTDAEFLRRVHLDLTGLPPTAAEVRAFLSDTRASKEKRDAVIDKLVGSDAYVEHWTNKWADLLQVNRKFLGEQGAAALRGYIRKAVADNMPYDQFAHSILTATGSTMANPPAAYYKVHRKADDVMENTTQLFLAVRFNCNKCHDHPFERWTQDQYYTLAAYFAQVGRSEDPNYKGQKIGGSAVEGAVPLVEVIADGGGEIKSERTGQNAVPKFPYTHADLAPEKAPRREQVAKWITSKENQYFAKSYVNRLWAYLLGKGLIEPIDDIRAGNPPSNPKLLDRLTSEFVASKFDVQAAVKTICKSRTYQLSFRTNDWNKDDDLNYSHALPRRLPAEVIFDSIMRATGSTPRLPGLPAGARAAQLLDSSVELPGGFLELFGKPARESACECERIAGVDTGAILAMVNGPVIGDALRDPSNGITKIVAGAKDDKAVIEELYLATLGRFPTEAEVTVGVKALSGAAADHKEMLDLHKKHADTLAAYAATLDTKQSAWEKSVQHAPTWTVLTPEKATSKRMATMTIQPDGSILVSGKMDGNEIYTVTAKTTLKGITGVRLEALPDDSLPAKGPGRAPNGNFVLSEFKATTAAANAADKPKPALFAKASQTFAQDTFPAQNAIDGNTNTGWAVSPRFGQESAALFEFKDVVTNEAGTVLTFQMEQNYQDKQHNLGKFRLSVTTDPSPALTGGLDPAISAILKTEPAMRTPEQAARVRDFFRSLDKEYARLQAEVAKNPAPPADPRVLGAQDLVWALLNGPAFLFNH